MSPILRFMNDIYFLCVLCVCLSCYYGNRKYKVRISMLRTTTAVTVADGWRCCHTQRKRAERVTFKKKKTQRAESRRQRELLTADWEVARAVLGWY